MKTCAFLCAAIVAATPLALAGCTDPPVATAAVTPQQSHPTPEPKPQPEPHPTPEPKPGPPDTGDPPPPVAPQLKH